MIVPQGMTLHKGVRVYRAGDELPPELEAMLPEDIRLRALEAETVPSAPPKPVAGQTEIETQAASEVAASRDDWANRGGKRR